MGLFAVAPAALAFNGLLATKGTHLRTTNAVTMAAPSEALATLEGYSVETGMKVWDPLGIAPDDPDELNWYRQAELKHGRVAMVATIGYIAAKTSLVFPGAIALDGTQFKDLISSNPFTEWDLLPDGGKVGNHTRRCMLLHSFVCTLSRIRNRCRSKSSCLPLSLS